VHHGLLLLCWMGACPLRHDIGNHLVKSDCLEGKAARV